MKEKARYEVVWKDKRGQQAHRLIMEEHIGRKLKDDEVVHHINENPRDNRIENLQLMGKSEHMSLHAKKRHKQLRNKPFAFTGDNKHLQGGISLDPEQVHDIKWRAHCGQGNKEIAELYGVSATTIWSVKYGRIPCYAKPPYVGENESIGKC